MTTVDVRLFKKEGTYKNKEGKEKQYTNFYIQCNDKMIPVEVKFFPNENFEGRDPGYQGRVAVLSMLAEPLPEKA